MRYLYRISQKLAFSASLVILLVMLAAPAVLAQKPDRSKPPELGPPPSLHLPDAWRTTLDNGLEVIVFEKRQVPIVQIDLMVKAGSAFDPKNKTGLATLTAAMLDEGAGSRDALALADAIDYLGAQLSTSAGFHTSRVSLNTPASRLDAALGIMADVVLRPTFPQAELERQRKQRLTNLMQAHDRPNVIASVLFNRVLYGKKHPYGAASTSDEKALRAIQTADLQKFHSSYFAPNNAVLIVVGAVSPEEIMPKIKSAFAGWARGEVKTPKWPEVKQVGKRTIYLVDRPGSAQSVIRIGRIGVPRLTEDYFPLVVMNTVLGGSFTSRLNQNIREEHGYAYGAGSRFSYRPLPGPFSAGAAVQTDVTDKALHEFMRELTGILQPVPDEELTRAKNYVALQYPGDFETVSRISGQLAQAALYKLPKNYFNTYISHIVAVTQADVQRVAGKYIDPEKMAIIIVGDRAKIEAGIRALQLGPIKVLSIEDVLGKVPSLAGTN